MPTPYQRKLLARFELAANAKGVFDPTWMPNVRSDSVQALQRAGLIVPVLEYCPLMAWGAGRWWVTGYRFPRARQEK